MYLRIDATGSFNFQSESKSQKYFNFYYDIPINLYSTFKNTWDFFDIISMSTYSTFVEYYPKILVLGTFSATNIVIQLYFFTIPSSHFFSSQCRRQNPLEPSTKKILPKNWVKRRKMSPKMKKTILTSCQQPLTKQTMYVMVKDVRPKLPLWVLHASIVDEGKSHWT